MKMSFAHALRLSGFILVGIGTLGLLLNEFVLDAGRAVTILFAALDLVGLLILAYPWIMKRSTKT